MTLFGCLLVDEGCKKVGKDSRDRIPHLCVPASLEGPLSYKDQHCLGSDGDRDGCNIIDNNPNHKSN